MEDRSYNGWKNYETWMIHLHITNDIGVCERMTAIVNAVRDELFKNEMFNGSLLLRQAGDILKEAVTDDIADYLDDNTNNPLKSMVFDSVLSALTEVYWPEIAQSLLETE